MQVQVPVSTKYKPRSTISIDGTISNTAILKIFHGCKGDALRPEKPIPHKN